ncbi:MAG: L,D-transpeptidase [Chloroflexota bacterium]
MLSAENMNSFSRRDFLKLSALSLLGLWLPLPTFSKQLFPNLQGRVIDTTITVFDLPSFSGNRVKVYWKDAVIPITEVTVGDELPEHNRVWYRIGEEGYAHSGTIQPVQTELQEPVLDIPQGGNLAEVTVPYTDAHWGPGKEYEVAYRLYYLTTHWVASCVTDQDNKPWYQIIDDKWEFVYYAPATHLRIIPLVELSPLSSHVPPRAKRIEVNTHLQTVIAYEWERPVFMARAATGAVFSNGDFSTPAGRHFTNHKRPSRHMAAGNLAYNGYDLPGVPWVSYITEEGIAIHGTYWHNDYGRPRSHGCINLTPQAAKWIFRWSHPLVPPHEQRVYETYGTPVDVI